jgi:hypothetical protein
LGDSDYFAGDLLGTRTRPLAELIEHTIEQGSATFMNQSDLFFFAEHGLAFQSCSHRQARVTFESRALVAVEQCPADVYKTSTRPYRGIGELSYPFHDRTALVTYCGRICIFKKKINLSTSLAGQAVGIKEVDDGIWLVSFMDYDLGYIDLEEKTLQPLNNPFGPRV